MATRLAPRRSRRPTEGFTRKHHQIPQTSLVLRNRGTSSNLEKTPCIPCDSKKSHDSEALRDLHGSGDVSGFTLIEVMLAVGIVTVGSVGIMAMHQASTLGNHYARQVTTATQVTQLWVERLRRDAVSWTQSGPAGLINTQYLRNTPVGVAPSEWLTPSPPEDSGEANSFDYQGLDTEDENTMTYCTQIQLRFLDATASMVRADVRTFWHRRGNGNGDGVSDRRLFPNCGSGAEEAITNELGRIPSRLHAVYASATIRWRPN